MFVSEDEEKTYVYIDGKFYPKDEAKISVYDHGLLYGDGVYEAIRAYDGLIFKLKEHMDRLYESAKSIKIEISLTKEEMTNAVLETLRKNKLKEAYIRIVVTRGKGPMGVDPRNCPKPTIIIITEKREPFFGGGEKGITAIITSIRRTPPWVMDPRIKSLNYLNNILARIEAIEAGAEESIMLNDRGFLAEGSTENLFLVKDGKVFTPPLTASILKGITRDAVIRIARELGFEVEERDLTMHELFNADEVFVTGTAAEIVPIVKVSGRVIGTGDVGPVVKKIITKFREMTKKPGEGIVL
jgi:branched-chain amino acid aminotransferase